MKRGFIGSMRDEFLNRLVHDAKEHCSDAVHYPLTAILLDSRWHPN